MPCAVIVCPTDCSSALPIVDFDICNPETHFGQISRMFVTSIGNPLTDWEDPVEWAARLALLAANPAKILELFVIGDKPAAESNIVEISRGRKIIGAKNHTVNFRIDETNDINYDALRQLECGGNYLVWYETYDGQLYGGNSGIIAFITMNEVIPESTQELVTYQGTLTWKSKHHPCRTDSPIAGQIDNP